MEHVLEIDPAITKSPIVIRASVFKPITVRPSGETVVIAPRRVVQIAPRRQKVLIARGSPIVIQPKPNSQAFVRPVEAVRVDLPKRGAWAERGWKLRNEGRAEIYEGNYQVRQGRFPGRIQVEGRSRRITAFIHRPPPEIKRHRKGPCFQQYGIGTGWSVLHWRRPAQSVDEAILYMERILDESLKR